MFLAYMKPAPFSIDKEFGNESEGKTPLDCPS